MTALTGTAATSRLGRPRRAHAGWARLAPSPSTVVFAVTVVPYLAVAAVLVLGHDLLPGDPLARVASAEAAVAGRDPHLAAIGFVWSPLPTIVLMPLVALGRWAPPLLAQGFAACIVSAVAMAATVAVVHRTLDDVGVGRSARLAATGLFAAHPAIVLFGANGMSDALSMLALAVACRHLLRWLRHEQVGALVACGVALAAGYLCRYEVVAPAAAIPALVALVSFHRRVKAGDRTRWEAALLDAALVGVPPALAFAAWALASWVIVGHPFEHFSSVYGNASQVEIPGSTTTGTAALALMAQQLMGLQPLMLVALLGGVALALHRRSPLVLAPLATFGPVVALLVVFGATGKTMLWIRYLLMIVPLVVVVVGVAVADLSARRRDRTGLGRRPVAAAVLVAAVLGPSVPVAGATLVDRRLSSYEAAHLIAFFDRPRLLPNERELVASHAFDRWVAGEIDAMGLGEGEVLVDMIFGFGVLVASDHRDQFLKSTDRDFEAALAAPAAFGVRYLLVAPTEGHAANDAVNRAYPGLRAGAGPGRLVRSFPGPGHRHWDLFEVTAPPAG